VNPRSQLFERRAWLREKCRNSPLNSLYLPVRSLSNSATPNTLPVKPRLEEVMRPVVAALLLLAFTFPPMASGQTKPAKKTPAKSKVVVQPVPGYKLMTIEGFNVLVNREVLDNNDDAAFERKPLDVLDLELKIISSIMKRSALDVLRKLIIWVEWDESEAGKNWVAVYYGGHQLSMLRRGKHPLKANNITVLRMKLLTAEHQPKDDAGRCVLLHEIAHAVHHQLIGYDNEPIKTAYAQALDRKLVDNADYAATNDKEFFAEMTCAYLDRLHYYPHTRADLEKHDPVTFRLMKSIWGQAKRTVATRPDPRPDATSYGLNVSLAGVKLKKQISGRTMSPQDLDGKVVLALYWGPKERSAAIALGKLQGWQDELGDFGMTAFGFNAREAPDHIIQGALLSQDVSFPFFGSEFLPGMVEEMWLPHAVLFDHTAKCIYRGSAFAAETSLREAVGKSVLASTGISQFEESLMPAVKNLQQGKPPFEVLRKLAALKPADEGARKQADLLLEKLREPAQKRLTQAELLADSEPLAAYVVLEPVPVRFKGTAEARRAVQLLTKLKSKKPVGQELKARPILSAVRKIDAQLEARPGSSEPTRPAFQRVNALALEQLQAYLQTMTRNYPETPATRKAVRIAGKYGVTVP
jgi:hypothetical protein